MAGNPDVQIDPLGGGNPDVQTEEDGGALVTQAELNAALATAALADLAADDARYAPLTDPRLNSIDAYEGGINTIGYYSTVPHAARSTSTFNVLGRMHLAPRRIRRTATFNKIGAELTTALATAILRVGYYAADPTSLLPTGAPLLDTSLDGNNGGTPAWIENTINLTLQPGLYWEFGIPQVALATWRSIGSPAYSLPYPSTAALIGTTPGVGLRVDGATGTPPTNPSLVTSTMTSTYPLIGLRRSA